MLNPIDNLNLVIVNFFYFKKNQEHSIFLPNFMIIETILCNQTFNYKKCYENSYFNHSHVHMALK